jgi:hypothetical protein
MFLPVVYRTTYRIAKEKEMKTKESMYMMGLKPGPYWLSWFVYYVILITVLCLLSWGLMFRVFANSNLNLIFLHIYSFGLSLFGIIMAI